MIPREVLEEVTETMLVLWHTASGMRMEYMRELGELEFPRGPESCGWVDLTVEVSS